MNWPIRNQIFFPFAGILLVAVVTIALTSALLAARRSEREHLQQIQGVIATLGQANFPYTKNVLGKMHGLSGGHFVVVNHQGRVTATTFAADISTADIPAPAESARDVQRLTELAVVDIAGTKYFVAVMPRGYGPRREHLYVFHAETAWRQARWEAVWPPLAIGGVTLLVMLLLSAALAQRLSRRFQTIQQLFARLADGKFDHAPATAPRDEVYELTLSANQLSDQLATMRDQISRTERLRLLAQLASGLAHQLRNAVTGAKMAIQLHQRRCREQVNDESLSVALRQLAITEEQIKGLLTLGRRDEYCASGGRLETVLDEIEMLLQPICEHARVTLQCNRTAGDKEIQFENVNTIKAALLNLVLNGMEAAGPDGVVSIDTETSGDCLRIQVADNGPGPPAEVESTLFDPFVTTKPEGVGMGLALVQFAANQYGGRVTWRRDALRTIFTLELSVRSLTTGMSTAGMSTAGTSTGASTAGTSTTIAAASSTNELLTNV